MFCVFLHLFISWWSTESVYGLTTHAVIGNYSELNPKDCEITRLTNGFDDNCFEWHKNPINSLIAGRNATMNEMPWIVQIVVTLSSNSKQICTGSIIDEEWVLTAGHCLSKSAKEKYSLILGYQSLKSLHKNLTIKALEIHKHPNFTGISTLSSYDIGLIKMKDPISKIKAFNISKAFEMQSNELKSICLPKEDILNTEEEYAFTAGWGYVDRDKFPLQTGYKKIHPDPYPNFVPFNCTAKNCSIKSNFIGLILVTAVDNQTFNCRGYSGTPLWQIYSGRAVLIGVQSFGYSNKTILNNKIVYCEGSKVSAHWFTRVSLYIDWIKNVTQLK